MTSPKLPVNRFFSSIWNSFKLRPLEILGFVATILALQLTRTSNNMTKDSLDVSKQALIQSDSQFTENNKSQVEQDKNSKEQHDSLMSVLKQQKLLLDLQLVSLKEQNKVTSRNLEVSKTQLNLSEKIQKRQIEEERALLTIENVAGGAGDIKKDSLTKYEIKINIKNLGKRPAINIESYASLITTDTKKVSLNSVSASNPLNHDESIQHSFEVSIKNIFEFYLFVEIRYKDELTNKSYKIPYYYNYKKNNSKGYEFVECDSDEKAKVIAVLKQPK